ncbi:hypothetical protein K435DRAFT_783392 [Dendrothele bispora CBS 962.96]|uniref:Uncharacterized protein n=1 Tax=Dendrothele bispora (strain CBS 962.96) TaxID=1314807 RepID=A0A4S8L9J9_DENBC|nr:hypothetical protein K435DRAFT_783392 [Dendrothele bispora CBS 962.96]
MYRKDDPSHFDPFKQGEQHHDMVDVQLDHSEYVDISDDEFDRDDGYDTSSLTFNSPESVKSRCEDPCIPTHPLFPNLVVSHLTHEELVLRYGGQDKVPHLLPQPNPEKMNSVHYAVFKGRPLHYKCQGYGVFELSILARARCDGVPGASFVRCDNAFAAYEVYYRARDEGVVVNL